MKFNLAFVVAVIGVGMVAADENLKSKLQMALKSMLNENEELQMENRDTKGRCDSATNSCNNHGTCTEDAWGSYYCRCQMPYRVGGKDSSCYLYHYRDVELEMLTRDSLRRCNADTNNCDGFGQCQAKQNRRYAGEYICMCETGYKNNLYGGCSPMTTREIEYLAMLSRDVQMELASKSFSQCNLDTNDCDGYGECVESEDGEYLCQCAEDYENNDYGGCSPIVTPAAEVDDDNFTERKKEIMRQLAEFLKEE